MIDLVIARPGGVPHRMKLSAGTYVLGRADTNEIVLDDKEVSRKHAQLLIDGDVVVVRDLGSGNGTFVGGRAVRESVVAPGAEIEIAPFSLSFTVAVAKPEARLDGVEGPVKGRRFVLTGDALSVGRHEEQDVHLDDSGVSRSHAMLVRRGEAWSVRDNGSANGIFVNDRRVRDAVLSSGDLLRIGNCVLRFVPAAEPEQEVELDEDPATVVLRSPGRNQPRLEPKPAPRGGQAAPSAPSAPADPIVTVVFGAMGALVLLVLVVVAYAGLSR
jgi:pSer/pThr/pTyr-binding forkhead associated (FHA) protein